MDNLITDCRFDWWQPTIQITPQEAQFFLKRIYPELDQVRSKPKNGAGDAFQVIRGDHVVVEAIFGGGIPEGMVNFICSGRDAIEFSQACQFRYPMQCAITRADVAIDFDDSSAWDFFYAWGLDLANRYKLKVEHQGDFHRAIDGRTIYIGSRTSVSRLVIYEKGKQIPEWGRPDLVRVELRVMPKKREARLHVGIMEAHQLYRCTAWAQDAGNFLFDNPQGFERVNIGTHWNPSDQARATKAFIRQYGHILTTLAIKAGGWSELGVEIGQKILEAQIEKDAAITRLQNLRQGKPAPSAPPGHLPLRGESLSLRDEASPLSLGFEHA